MTDRNSHDGSQTLESVNINHSMELKSSREHFKGKVFTSEEFDGINMCLNIDFLLSTHSVKANVEPSSKQVKNNMSNVFPANLQIVVQKQESTCNSALKMSRATVQREIHIGVRSVRESIDKTSRASLVLLASPKLLPRGFLTLDKILKGNRQDTSVFCSLHRTDRSYPSDARRIPWLAQMSNTEYGLSKRLQFGLDNAKRI